MAHLVNKREQQGIRRPPTRAPLSWTPIFGVPGDWAALGTPYVPPLDKLSNCFPPHNHHLCQALIRLGALRDPRGTPALSPGWGGTPADSGSQASVPGS